MTSQSITDYHFISHFDMYSIIMRNTTLYPHPLASPNNTTYLTPPMGRLTYADACSVFSFLPPALPILMPAPWESLKEVPITSFSLHSSTHTSFVSQQCSTSHLTIRKKTLTHWSLLLEIHLFRCTPIFVLLKGRKQGLNLSRMWIFLMQNEICKIIQCNEA